MELKYKSAAVEIDMNSWNGENAVGMGVGLLGDEKGPIEMDEVCLSLKRYSAIERGFLAFEETS